MQKVFLVLMLLLGFLGCGKKDLDIEIINKKLSIELYDTNIIEFVMDTSNKYEALIRLELINGDIETYQKGLENNMNIIDRNRLCLSGVSSLQKAKRYDMQNLIDEYNKIQIKDKLDNKLDHKLVAFGKIINISDFVINSKLKSCRR